MHYTNHVNLIPAQSWNVPMLCTGLFHYSGTEYTDHTHQLSSHLAFVCVNTSAVDGAHKGKSDRGLLASHLHFAFFFSYEETVSTLDGGQ